MHLSSPLLAAEASQKADKTAAPEVRLLHRHYVISADGVAHRHPSPDTLTWITNARGQDGYAIHLTNSIPAAMSQLQKLAAGRNFTVEARTDPKRGIALMFEASA
jgi:hypothetical protein